VAHAAVAIREALALRAGARPSLSHSDRRAWCSVCIP
jgi:hypothetical protein